ncbi:MAG: hypothetical protein II299_06655 [Alistipes sp.]|nr:hypothetical protein [Alistipes sp.]
MKKLIFAAFAIAAMVACSKDEAPTLDSSRKSISINITNMVSQTKAVTTPSDDENYKCAEASDLTIVFCNASGNKVGDAVALNSVTPNGSAYTFHGLDQSVTQFFVIGTGNSPVLSVPASITAAEEMWNSDQTNAEVGALIVYGKSGSFTYVSECTDPANSSVKYPLFQASAEVKPNVARVEVSSITCTDLGAREADVNPSTLGFDKITLKKLALGSMEQPLTNVLNAANPVVAVTATPDNGKVWSWNFAGGDVALYPLSLTMVATSETTAYANPEHTISTTTFNEGATALTSFAKGHIYKMAIEFSEDLLSAEKICVNVTVSIADWTVHNDITPVFGN